MAAKSSPGPLAGIDEGDKIRTIYDGSVGGANDTIRNQTVERTTRRLRRCWMGSKPFIGYMRQLRRNPFSGCCWPSPERGSSNLHLGPGYGSAARPTGE